MTNHKPKPRTRVGVQPPTGHRLARLVPAVLATLRMPASTVGFGTAAGYMRVCQCGYATRNSNRFARTWSTRSERPS